MDDLHKIVRGDHDMWRDEIPLGPQRMQILKLVIEYAWLRCQLWVMVELNLNSIREYYAPEFLCTSHFKFITKPNLWHSTQHCMAMARFNTIVIIITIVHSFNQTFKPRHVLCFQNHKPLNKNFNLPPCQLYIYKGGF